MSLQPLPLIFQDDERIISNAFSSTLIEAGVAGDRWDHKTIDICCELIEESGIGSTVEDAWWYNPAAPESARFAGPIIDTKMFSITKGWANNGNGKVVRTPRNIVMRLVLLAADEVALDYGVEATMRKLGVDVSGGGCKAWNGTIYKGCDETLERTFCRARILDCRETSTEPHDQFWLGGRTNDGDCPVGCVLDVTLSIDDGCLWGPPIAGPTIDISEGNAEQLELCNPAAVHQPSCCPEIFSLLSGLVLSCFPIPDEFQCAPDFIPPTDQGEPGCDPYCPPIFMCRDVIEFAGVTDPGLEYAPSFTITNPGPADLTQTEITIWPMSIFTDAGIDPRDPRLAGLPLCVEPPFRARLPWVGAGTTVTFDGRCGDTEVDCGDGIPPYDPRQLWAPSGVPTPMTFSGEQDWVAFIDSNCASPTVGVTVDLQLTPCHIS